MSLLVRKISRAKWPNSSCAVKDIEADAIADLRTRGNTLSVWRVEDFTEIDEAVLALAASSKTEKIENMCIVWADEQIFQDKGITVSSDVDGDTVVIDLKNKHRDLSGLSYESLGTMSEIIMDGLESENTKRITRANVKKLLVKAYKENRISKESCTESFYKELLQAVDQCQA